MKHWPLRRVQVAGDSMRPALEPGDRLVIVAVPGLGGGRLRPGDVVALTDPREPARIVVKRVAGVNADGVTVLGDRPDASTDSRTFGPVPRRLVHGRAVYRYWPEDRRGRIRRR
jgi:nickel-type superoxide dismutase maturation protease